MTELPESGLNWKGCRFLDPMGKVFEYEGEFYRAIYPHKVDYVHSLFKRGIIERLVKKGLIVETKITKLKVKGYGLVLWHQRIPYLTTPDEWTRSFIRDAALCGIDLNLKLLPYGLGTIDFHCGNIQQQSTCSPVWIDLGSICPLDSIDQGKSALAELKKYYLHPLYLLSQNKHLNRTCRLLMANGGIAEDEFNDLTNNLISIAGHDRKSLLEKIRDWICSLKFPPLSTQWGDYQPTSTDFKFNPNKADPRTKLIYHVIRDLEPKNVVDLSCNAGKFSLMAGRLGSAVFSVDLDEVAVERLYHTAKNINEDISITTALRNLAYNQKHIIQGELVLALALSHHLGISQKYPFSHIAKVFSSYSSEALLAEFMPNGLGGTQRVPDPLPTGYSLKNFIKSFEPYFRRIETIYYPVPKDWGYRVFIFCSEKRHADEKNEKVSDLSTSIFNPHNQDSQIAVICQHCGYEYEITYNSHSSCPKCKKAFTVKKLSFETCNTDKHANLVAPEQSCLCSDQSAVDKVGNHQKLEELLNHTIEISDLLSESKCQFDEYSNIHVRRPEKVVHISTHDFGGAGKAAYHLHTGLQKIGVETTMLVMNKKYEDPSVKVFPEKFGPNYVTCENSKNNYSALYAKQKARWNDLLKNYSNRPKGLEFFTDTQSDIRLDHLKEFKEADIINLHWVAGTLDYLTAPISFQGKKTVWTLHDMNPFTGGCHYSVNCEKYKKQCGACPQLGSTNENDLSREIWHQKFYAYQNLNLHIVTPSRWLANCVAESSLLSKFPVTVIPNGIPLDTYQPYPKSEIRQALNISESAQVILFGAVSVNNQRKGFKYLLAAMEKVSTDPGRESILLTFGQMPENDQIKSKFPIGCLGEILDEYQLALAYSAADVFVIPSLEDNLPNTVIEAMACGVPVVGFDIGGMPDLIEHKQNGFLAKFKDIPDLVNGIEWALSTKMTSNDISALCRKKVEKQFAQEIQAVAYKKLYDLITSSSSVKSNSVVSSPNDMVANSKQDQKTAVQIYENAHQLLDKQRIDEAIETLEKLIEMVPGFATAYNDLGVLYGNAGENEKALRFYEKALQLQPENITFKKNLADFNYAIRGEIEEALKMYLEILQSDSKDIEVLLRLGKACSDLQRFEDANVFFQRVLEMDPENKSAVFGCQNIEHLFNTQQQQT